MLTHDQQSTYLNYCVLPVFPNNTHSYPHAPIIASTFLPTRTYATTHSSAIQKLLDPLSFPTLRTTNNMRAHEYGKRALGIASAYSAGPPPSGALEVVRRAARLAASSSVRTVQYGDNRR